MSVKLYIIRRLFYMIVLLFVISIVSFIIIQLPPGDYLSAYIAQLRMSGQRLDEAQIASLTRQYGLDLPIYQQYFKWIWNILRGNLGRSFQWNRPVDELLAERLPITLIISSLTLIFTYVMAVPIGIYSAIRQYSIFDYAFIVIGFIGLAVPNFLLALVLMYLFYRFFGISPMGLFSPAYVDASWSMAKFLDMLSHIWVPIIVIGTAGTAGIIRVMRGCLLDELNRQYVITARAKGVSERRLLFKYPVRMAINPIISTVGWILPGIFSGGAITAIVLRLPTIGPLLLDALIVQDMYLAGSIVLILCFLTIVGTFISDILLALADPRIRYEARE